MKEISRVSSESIGFMIAKSMKKFGQPLDIGVEDNGIFPIMVSDETTSSKFSDILFIPEMLLLFDAIEGITIQEDELKKARLPRGQRSKIKALSFYQKSRIYESMGIHEHKEAVELEKRARELISEDAEMPLPEVFQPLVDKIVKRELRKKNS